MSFDVIFLMDYISQTCLAFLIFTECIVIMKHFTFNYYIYLMRMTLNLAGKEMISCSVVIATLIMAYASFQYFTVGPYSYAFRDMLSASMVTLRTAIAIVKMKIYFESSFSDALMNKAMFITFTIFVTLITMNMFISIINIAMETVKGDKICKGEKKKIFDAELNKYFWRRVRHIFQLMTKARKESIKRERHLKSDDAGIGRLCHIGHGFLKFSLMLYNSDRKARNMVV